MENAGYVIAGWALTAAAVGGYWLWIARRARRARRVLVGLSARVPAGGPAGGDAAPGER